MAKTFSPLRGLELRSFRARMAAWAVGIFCDEVRRSPGSAGKALRGMWRLGRLTDVYLSAAKPVRFGRPAEGGCVKAGLYVPRWPSDALAGRVRRWLRSQQVHHEQVTLSVTDECPYRCPHCFNARRPAAPMPLSRLKELVKEIQDIGGSFLNIGGGEPGVAMDRTLAVLEAADGRSEVWLNTTGFNMDARAARTLTDAGVFGVRVSTRPSRASRTSRPPGRFPS